MTRPTDTAWTSDPDRSEVDGVAARELGRSGEPAPSLPPCALARSDAITGRARRLAVFLDYDGTLTPIVERPEAAQLSASMREAVVALKAAVPVAVVSGRDLADVMQRVGVDGVIYAGSHGFDIAGPHGRQAPDAAAAALPALDAAQREISEAVAGIAGAQVERKRFALATHYRRVPDADIARVESAVARAQAAHPSLRRKDGKKVFELLPNIAWDKGKAVEWLLAALDLDDDVVPLYIGDDVTDEDAFLALRERGIGIAVLDAPAHTHARYALRDPGEVERFLRLLAACAGPRR